MFNNFSLILIITCTASIMAAILIPIMVILTIIVYNKTRKKLVIILSSILLFVLSFVVWLSAPFYFHFKGLSVFPDDNKTHSYYVLAAKTAVIPDVKGYMYWTLGIHDYLRLQNGPSAINYLEKSLTYSNADEAKLPLGYLYLIKGDYNTSIKILSSIKNYKNGQSLAIDYYLTKDYPKALAIINEQLTKNKIYRPDAYRTRALYRTRAAIYKKLNKQDLANKDLLYVLKQTNLLIKQTPDDCWNYERRALIYGDLGKTKLAETDFQKAKKICPQNDAIINNYNSSFGSIEEQYSRAKITYHF